VPVLLVAQVLGTTPPETPEATVVQRVFGGGIINGSGCSVRSYNSLIGLNTVGAGGVAGAGYVGDPDSNIGPGNDGNPGADGLGTDLFRRFSLQPVTTLCAKAMTVLVLPMLSRHDIVGTIAAPANVRHFKFRE